MRAHLYVIPGPYAYVHYSGARKKLLKEACMTEEVKIPSASIFVGQGNVQHAVSEGHGEHRTRHHSYLIPENHDLRDTFAFAYKDSNPLGSEKTAVSP